jgi:hypothetical protein
MGKIKGKPQQPSNPVVPFPRAVCRTGPPLPRMFDHEGPNIAHIASVVADKFGMPAFEVENLLAPLLETLTREAIEHDRAFSRPPEAAVSVDVWTPAPRL